MNQDIKKKWVEALRSGDYTQGKGSLHNIVNEKSYFCCLGVLCDLHAQETGGEWKLKQGVSENKELSYLMYVGGLPSQVITWAKMWERRVGSVTNDIKLSELNDNGHTFSEIADLIEEYL